MGLIGLDQSKRLLLICLRQSLWLRVIAGLSRNLLIREQIRQYKMVPYQKV